MNLSTGIDLGAVDLAECPAPKTIQNKRGRTIRCKCGLCRLCRFPKHSAIHGPSYGQPPGSKPWGHRFEQEESR